MTTLTNIKNFIQNKKQTSIFAIAKNFNEDPDFIMHMLEYFINKGVVKCNQQKICGSSCNKTCIQRYMLSVQWI